MSDDRQAHVDLMNNYAHALDTRDWDLLASLFVTDAQFVARLYEENSVPGQDFQTTDGCDAIVGFIRKTWDGLSATHHMLSNYVVHLGSDGRTAKASCYLRAYHVGNRERAHLFEESLGRFDFHTVMDGGGWKVRKMEENIFIMLGTSDAFPPLD